MVVLKHIAADVIFLVVIAFAIGIIVGYAIPGQMDLSNIFGGGNSTSDFPDQWSKASSTNVCPTVDYGDGIVGFFCTDELFITSLSNFEQVNQVSINAITSFPDSNVPNGNYGYVVTFIKHQEWEENMSLKNIDGSSLSKVTSLYTNKFED